MLFYFIYFYPQYYSPEVKKLYKQMKLHKCYLKGIWNNEMKKVLLCLIFMFDLILNN